MKRVWEFNAKFPLSPVSHPPSSKVSNEINGKLMMPWNIFLTFDYIKIKSLKSEPWFSLPLKEREKSEL